MDFLNKLYESNYFGIGLFAVIAFLVVTFLIVLFFGKKDEKKRKLEATQKINSENSFKETTEATPIEIPTNLEPVAPINLETNLNDNILNSQAPISNTVTPVNTIVEPVTPIMPNNQVNSTLFNSPKDNNDNYIDNLSIEKEEKPIIEEPKVEPIIAPVQPILEENNLPEPPFKVVEPTKIEIPKELSDPKSEELTPIIKEEEPVLQINEEPIINTYYKPTPKTQEVESIKVPNIDFDSLAKSISKELDELENNSKKYEEVKVTPLKEVTNTIPTRKTETFSSVYVKEPIREMPKEELELPKKIELPARKS